ncbi:hypothetical protein ROZALSC1DRAFT_25889 [Rozella allomycis CSF55]|uniref:Uncharacterized protein n=1 Tax=Rozella allomycis (strain CSF55) TaxID=988480 RepID=A0A4P9YA17_ROZAC|nr:hypothetical protein ROZALSC1DRAFT_25889 [Rozella allomycis CSF55]
MRRKRLREDYELDELTISCPGTPKRVKCSIPLSSSEDDKDTITEDECVAKSITPAKSEECQSEEESDLLVETEVSRCYSQLGADSSDEKMMSFEGSEEESKEYNVDSDPNVIDESLTQSPHSVNSPPSSASNCEVRVLEGFSTYKNVIKDFKRFFKYTEVTRKTIRIISFLKKSKNDYPFSK